VTDDRVLDPPDVCPVSGLRYRSLRGLVRGVLIRRDLLAWGVVITAVLLLVVWAILAYPLPPSYQDDLTPEPKSKQELERSYPNFYADPSAEPSEAPNFKRETTA
jgi:hypothetical protein